MPPMPWAIMASWCSGFDRTASRPPWTAGCSVFTRPSIISGNPVTSETSVTGTPAASRAARVPPVDRSTTPKAANASAKGTRPDLSDTEMSARATRRKS